MMNNFQKLGMTLNERMQSVYEGRSNVIAELGTITKSLGLQVNSLGNTIPKGDYLVSRMLIMGASGATMAKTKSGQGQHGHGPSGSHSQAEGSGTHSHPATEGAHVHDVQLPAAMAGLKSGDLVLVIWCDNEPVVTDILVSS